MRILLIDDIRTPALIKHTYGLFDHDYTHATNYEDGIKALKSNEPFDLLCLDHDLASYCPETGKELTGYSVMLFLEANPEFRPKDYLLVTANPVGRDNMQRVIDAMKSKS
jgi:CheY-like chemotaxis protein